MRVGLIGAGRWAEAHRRTLAEAGPELGAELVAVLTSRPETAARAAEAWGVPAEHELDAFLAHDLDAVIVASPNHLHVPHATAALRSGRHVLLEKPMALDLAGADALLDAARGAGRTLALGHEMRVFAWAEAAKRVVDEGRIGAPRHLALDLWRRPYRGGAGGWKADPARVGSTILEEPIHYLDLARWILGDPTALQAFATSRAGREGAWENLDVRLWFGDAAQASVTRTIAGWGHRATLGIVGDDGSFRASWIGAFDADPAPRVEAWLHAGRGRDEPAERLDVRTATGHAFDLPRQLAAFVAACRGEASPPADGADGRAAVRLCLEAERSLREGEARRAL